MISVLCTDADISLVAVSDRDCRMLVLDLGTLTISTKNSSIRPADSDGTVPVTGCNFH